MDKITVPVTFTVGTLQEMGLTGFHQAWLNGEGSGGRRFGLTCGAGLASPWLEASAEEGAGQEHKGLYARTNAADLARALWDELGARLADTPTDSAARAATPCDTCGVTFAEHPPATLEDGHRWHATMGAVAARGGAASE